VSADSFDCWTITRLPDDPRLSPSAAAARQLRTRKSSAPKSEWEREDGFQIDDAGVVSFEVETAPCLDCLDRGALNSVGLPYARPDGSWTAGGCQTCLGAGRVERATGLPVKGRYGTGKLRGRPTTGVCDTRRVEEELLRLLWDDEDIFDAYFNASGAAYNGKRAKTAAKDFRYVLTAKALGEANHNAATLSRVTGKSLSTLYDWRDRGRERLEKLGTNSPIDEENEMRETTVLEHIDSRFEKLERKLESEVNDVMRVLAAFRETPAEDWRRNIDSPGDERAQQE
jgi:hypothetical protein